MSEERVAAETPVALIGGHPVLDFVNTVAWRRDPGRRVDRVTGADAWARWAVAAGLLDASATDGEATEAAAADERRLLRLREALWTILDAHVDGRPLPPDPWERLHRALVRAREETPLPPVLPLRWQPGTAGLEGLEPVLALRAEELLAGDDIDRIRLCAGPGCGWFFLDRSRGATRRWCSSADCGNRDRARRHYARTHPAGKTSATGRAAT